MLKRIAYFIFGFVVVGMLLIMQNRETELWGSDMKAVEFPAQTRWLNTSEKVTLSSLRGRVVILDFWTYCCINCLHTLPRLAELEKAYSDKPLTVLGIHSGKFEQERSDEKVRQAIEKYEIHHPVAMDDDYSIWNRWGVRAWPTLVFIDTEGNVAGTTSGEPELGELKRIVDALLEKAGTPGTLKTAVPSLIKMDNSNTMLRYPGKILVQDGRLYIADSGNHRILVADAKDGELLETYGGNESGFTDGSAADARFNQPQGMVLTDGILYVADRNNHAIRAVDLSDGKVSTIAGTGRKGSWRISSGSAKSIDLRSPWDLALRDGGLDIAMAGSHQIWRYEIKSERLNLLAGSGAENIIDGSFENAAFAQPSGLWVSGDKLYVADSETSAVRKLDLATRQVTSLVGTGLFDFGSRDGRGKTAQLQHPLGITGREHMLYVADSFNNAIRSINLDDGVMVKTLKIEGTDALNEPSGLALDKDILYVADTNNHRIIRIDLKSLQTEEVIIHKRIAANVGDLNCEDGLCRLR